LAFRMIESFEIRAIGHINSTIKHIIAERAEQLLNKLLLEAVQLWSAERFHRYDNNERSHTVRILDCCLRVIDENELDWPQVDIDYDSALLSRDMLCGNADPLRAPIPDMNFRFGSAQIHLEAKRLHLGDKLPSLYVSKGMLRFVDGRYRPHDEPLGAMLGYVTKDPPSRILKAVNAAIVRSSHMDASHKLTKLSIVVPFGEAYESFHGTKFRLLHYWIEIDSAVAGGGTADRE
jgi:hypothetical protein